MAEITTTQSFADGDTVTAAKLNNILGNSSISSEIITNRSELTAVDGASDFVLGYDTSASSLRKIKPNNIISDSSISTNKIANLSITTGKINDLAVTTGKIADSAITTEKITDSNITSAKIADANITTAKIADASVTNDKLSVLSPNPEGTYGGSGSIPTIVVNSRGRVTSVTTSSIPSAGPAGVSAFTSSGTFSVPAGVTKLRILAIGGGGGGGTGRSSSGTGGNNGAPGAGGTASGGDFNLNGVAGSISPSWVRSYGAGGVGGGEQFNGAGGRGGSGAVVMAVVGVTPSSNYSVTIGAGGGSQGAGGATTFNGNDKNISAGGGSQGGNGVSLAAPGGSGTSGYLQIEW